MSNGHAFWFPWIDHHCLDFVHPLTIMFGTGSFLVLHYWPPCMHRTTIWPCYVTSYAPYFPPLLSCKTQVFLQVFLHYERFEWWVNCEKLCKISMDGLPLLGSVQPKVTDWHMQVMACNLPYLLLPICFTTQDSPMSSMAILTNGDYPKVIHYFNCLCNFPWNFLASFSCP
jgi:hypothetical protein